MWSNTAIKQIFQLNCYYFGLNPLGQSVGEDGHSWDDPEKTDISEERSVCLISIKHHSPFIFPDSENSLLLMLGSRPGWPDQLVIFAGILF